MKTTNLILAVNAGSSSLKARLYRHHLDLQLLLKAQVDAIGSTPSLNVKDADGQVVHAWQGGADEIPDQASAVHHLIGVLNSLGSDIPCAVGHRVVHGGPDFEAPVRITAQNLQKLEALTALAPLHQPANLEAIRIFGDCYPQSRQVACFDTAFHRTQPDLADHFAIDLKFYEEGIRRYGFHGLSYEYISRRLKDLEPVKSAGKWVIAHLGSGASLCAIEKGRSVGSTMGFTALEGLPMGTRSGQIDPGVIFHLAQEHNMDLRAIEQLLYKKSGLLGLSGISNDVRVLEKSEDARAKFSLDYFSYQTACQTASLAAAMQGIDGFVFTAGIGENSPTIRAQIIQRLGWLGLDLDEVANMDGPPQRRISRASAQHPVWVIATDEERMIAEHTVEVLKL